MGVGSGAYAGGSNFSGSMVQSGQQQVTPEMVQMVLSVMQGGGCGGRVGFQAE